MILWHNNLLKCKKCYGLTGIAIWNIEKCKIYLLKTKKKLRKTEKIMEVKSM